MKKMKKKKMKVEDEKKHQAQSAVEHDRGERRTSWRAAERGHRALMAASQESAAP
jgi:hypothetical protein